MPQTTNQQRTQNTTTCLILPIRKDGGRTSLSEVEDMPRTTKLTNRTRHASTQNTKQNHMPIKKKVADVSQLLHKKPTQNTKQNHMLTKREGVPKATLQSRRHASNY